MALKNTYKNFIQILSSLKKAITVFSIFVKEGKNYNPHMDYEEEYRSLRDSLIQRFEYCVDLFWKYIKKDLEVRHVAPEIKSPADVIRKAYSLGMITESDAESILDMIKNRNMTSHMYVEEIAEVLAKEIPSYYQLMSEIIEKIKPS